MRGRAASGSAPDVPVGIPRGALDAVDGTTIAATPVGVVGLLGGVCRG